MTKYVKEKALRTLAEKLANLNWSSYQIAVRGSVETVQRWLGDEEVMVCVFSGREYREKFHRQDYYFLNFAYRGDYDAVSQRTGNTMSRRRHSTRRFCRFSSATSVCSAFSSAQGTTDSPTNAYTSRSPPDLRCGTSSN